jgi:hypothetical protein
VGGGTVNATELRDICHKSLGYKYQPISEIATALGAEWNHDWFVTPIQPNRRHCMLFMTEKRLGKIVAEAMETGFKKAIAGDDEKAKVLNYLLELEKVQNQVIKLKDDVANARRNALDEAALARRKVEDELVSTKREMANNTLEMDFLAKKKDEIQSIDLKRRENELESLYMKKDHELNQKHFKETLERLDTFSNRLESLYKEMWTKFPSLTGAFSREVIEDK